MANKILICLMLTLTISQLCCGSAIPMWEFLSRTEKMSHLYSIFAKLVSDYCKTSYEVRNFPVAQCKRDLLTYASDKLQQMPDASLDILDPYQRGANDLVWNTIMKDHPNVRPTTKRPQYNNNNAQSSAVSSSPSSNQIQNLNPSTPSTLLSGDSSIIVFGNNQVNGYQKNPLFDGVDSTPSSSSSSAISSSYQNSNSSSLSSYAMAMDAVYGNFHHSNNNNKAQSQLQTINEKPLSGSSGIIASALVSSINHPQSINQNDKNNNNQEIYQISDIEIFHEPTSQNFLSLPPPPPPPQQQSLIESSTNYLSGPLVIRVRPDGTPVEEDKYKPLPRDDDRDFIIGNTPFNRRQKEFTLPPPEIIYFNQQEEQQQHQQLQRQLQQQQHLQQQYQRYQQNLRRQYRNSNSFRTLRRY